MSIPVYQQRFSIYYNNNLFLRSYTDNNGTTTIINNIGIARALVKLYAKQFKVSPDVFEIRANKTGEKINDDLSDRILSLGKNKQLQASKMISGQGLKYRTVIDRMSDKYNSEKYEHSGPINHAAHVRLGTKLQVLVNKDTGERIERVIDITKPSVDNYRGINYFRNMERRIGISINKGATTSCNIDDDNTNWVVQDFDTARKIQSLSSGLKDIPRVTFNCIRTIKSKHTKINDVIKEIKSVFNVSRSVAYTMLCKHE